MTDDMIMRLFESTEGYGVFVLGAIFVYKMRKSIGKNVREYVDEFKEELIESNTVATNQMKDEFTKEVNKSMECQLDIVHKLIESNQNMNTKMVEAIGQAIVALDMHTEELVIIIQKQGWTERSIHKIRKALDQANIKIEDLHDDKDLN